MTGYYRGKKDDLYRVGNWPRIFITEQFLVCDQFFLDVLLFGLIIG